MPAKNEDLHGNVPDEATVALLIIDMINDFEFPGGDALLTAALPAAERIAHLKRRAEKAGIPILYVNDNFGKWRSDFQQQVRHCLHDHVRGRPVAQMLKPDEDDYFVLKPKHSAFYATPLDLLLTYLKVTTLILTGIAGDVCVLFTAGDAFLRDYHLFVPSDCIASQTSDENTRSLEQMRKTFDADIRPSDALDLDAMKRPPENPGKRA
ncbi:MAG: Isochorismatase [Chthonomonadaceae bacterium]|nr:Isochorismatase [Chthonomonadaceae bacterium]